jgi:hypothetical protein
MSAYVPTELTAIVPVALALLAGLVAGYALLRAPTTVARAIGWAALVLGTLWIERVVAHQPPGVRMIALVAFALLVMKVLVAIEELAGGMAPLSLAAWLGFAAAWIGMQPRLFSAKHAARLPGAGALARRGGVHVILGAGLLLLASASWVRGHSHLLATLLLLPAVSLIVHFGMCNLLAGAWRRVGVACESLFVAPLYAQSLGEFWGRRWNLAFSEMTASVVYRPLSARLGKGPALMASFALSGVLHEMAISVPVRAGLGLPLLYFLLHGALVLVERALARSGRPIAGTPGRVWTLVWLAAPLPLLFHRAFLAGVVWPLAGIPPEG